MNINLSPGRSDETLTVSKNGNTLTLNGEKFDFSRMKDGDTLPLEAITSRWFAGQVEMVGESLEVTLRLPLPVNYSAEQAFPAPLLNVPDGVVVLPQPLIQPEPPAEVVEIKDNQE